MRGMVVTTPLIIEGPHLSSRGGGATDYLRFGNRLSIMPRRRTGNVVVLKVFLNLMENGGER
jgi:hypothetical protein